MTKTEQAVLFFKEGYSCSQAVLASYAEDLGLPWDLAMKLAQPFGGGIAKMADALRGEGGRNIVKMEYAHKLSAMRISGQPFTIQSTTERFMHQDAQQRTQSSPTTGARAAAGQEVSQ